MKRLIFGAVLFLMIMSPLTFVWHGESKDREKFKYDILIAPFYYSVSYNNSVGYQDETKIGRLNDLSPIDLYYDGDISQLTLWLFSAGWFYLITTVLMIFLFTEGVMSDSRRTMDFAMALYLVAYLVFIVYLFLFLKEVNLSFWGESRGIVGSPSVGFYLPIIGGVLYAVGRVMRS